MIYCLLPGRVSRVTTLGSRLDELVRENTTTCYINIKRPLGERAAKTVNIAGRKCTVPALEVHQRQCNLYGSLCGMAVHTQSKT